MEDRFKFRAFSIANQRHIIFGLHNMPSWVHEAEVEQSTGLYDNTKWENLTEKEKVYYFNEYYKSYSRITHPSLFAKYVTNGDKPDWWRGKLIFEGDVVKSHLYSHIFKVVYYQPEASFLLKSKINGRARISCLHQNDITKWQKWKIIGNIHEDPELLEMGE